MFNISSVWYLPESFISFLQTANHRGTVTSWESCPPQLTGPAVAMGLLKMALRIPVNEGCWGRGRERQANKSAICSVFARHPLSQILRRYWAAEHWGGALPVSSLWLELLLWRTLVVFAERMGLPGTASGNHVSWQQPLTFTHWEKRTTKGRRRQSCLRQTATANHQIIRSNTDISQEREIYMIKLSSAEFSITCRSSVRLLLL